MPRANYSTAKASRRSHRTVNYVNVKGQTVLAKVTGGSGTSLNLRIPHRPLASKEVSGVSKRTAVTQTNVWY